LGDKFLELDPILIEDAHLTQIRRFLLLRYMLELMCYFLALVSRKIMAPVRW